MSREYVEDRKETIEDLEIFIFSFWSERENTVRGTQPGTVLGPETQSMPVS